MSISHNRAARIHDLQYARAGLQDHTHIDLQRESIGKVRYGHRAFYQSRQDLAAQIAETFSPRIFGAPKTPPRPKTARADVEVKVKVDLESVLPVGKVLPEILSTMQNGNTLLLTAPMGSGKTVLVAHKLSSEGFRVITGAPRRDITERCTVFQSQFRGMPLGDQIGFRHSQASICSENTNNLACTYGTLAVIEYGMHMRKETYAKNEVRFLDDGHCGAAELDVLRAFYMMKRSHGNAPKIIEASGTPDTEKLRKLYGDVPSIEVEGRQFPITELPTTGDLIEDVTRALDRGRRVLVFVPGKRWIAETIDRLKEVRPGLEPIPFHAGLPHHKRMQAFREPKPGEEFVIVATNIADNGLTLHINTVIMDGYTRIMTLIDGVPSLIVVPDSQASKDQKGGRAGRLEPGEKIDVSGADNTWSNHHPPELKSIHIDSLYLRAAAAGINFPYMMRHGPVQPDSQQYADAERRLQHLGLLEGDSMRKPLAASRSSDIAKARRMWAKLPISPSCGRMLFEAREIDQAQGKFTNVMTDVVAVIQSEGIISAAKPGLLRHFRLDDFPNSDPLRQAKLFSLAARLGPDHYVNLGIDEAKMENALALRANLRERQGMEGLEFNTEPFTSNELLELVDCISHGMVYSLYKERGDTPRRFEDVEGDEYPGQRNLDYVKIRERGVKGCDAARKIPRPTLAVPATETGFFVGMPFNIGTLDDNGHQEIVKLLTMPTEITEQFLYEVYVNGKCSGSFGDGVREQMRIERSRQVYFASKYSNRETVRRGPYR